MALLTIGSTISQVHAEKMKVASVDVRKIFDQWKYAIEAEEKLEAARAALESENNERLAVINQLKMERGKMSQKYNANKGSVSTEEKAKLDNKYISLGRDAFALEQNRNDYYLKSKRIMDRDVTSTSKLILDKITEAVRAYAAKESYDMVIEMGGHTTRNVPFFMHLDGAVDITDILIKQLNAAQ